MNTILVVNHNIINCGVYQYGKRIFDICKKSKIYDFQYVEVTCPEDLLTFIKNKIPDIIFYNYIPATMPWFNDSIFNQIKSFGAS
jgi:predicted nucleic acid-binding protein